MTRVLSATLLIAVVVSVLLWTPPWATAALAAVVAALGAAELADLTAKAGAALPKVFVAIAASTLTLAFVLHERRVPGADEDSLGAVLLALLVVAGTVTLALGPPDRSTLTRASAMVMAPIYVGLPLGAIVWVRWVCGAGATLWLLGTIVVSDSAQYYTGRAFGRRKLAPAVSPAKTVEGAIGGLAAAAVSGFFLGPRVLPELSPTVAAAIAVVLALFGIAGDLFESLLKRGVGAKDSSSLIPGHGGVLDRIDAQLFAAPVFFLFLRYIV